jgi:Uma2 family endonuclease
LLIGLRHEWRTLIDVIHEGVPIMGSIASPEALALKWEEVLRDPSLRDLPYKIELNAWGKIELSPAKVRHARVQGYIAAGLARQLTGGEMLLQCPVLTAIGIRVPDVAWASESFMRSHGAADVFPCAPEICVEVVSESNTKSEITEKIRAYLAAGAEEVWIATEAGELHYFDASGERPASRFLVTLSLPKLAK